MGVINSNVSKFQRCVTSVSVKKFLVLVVALSSFFVAVSVNYLDKKIYPVALQEEIRFVPNKKIVDFLCFDHKGFASDLFFIKVNLHSGGLMWKPLDFQFDSAWSYAMMNLITELDPKYRTAYLFSAMGLIHNFDDVKLAKPILERGIKTFPEDWEIPFWMGYDHYVYLEDYEIASQYLWLASQKPNAPKHFFALLLSALKKGGGYEKGAWTLRVMMEDAKDERLKTIYKKKLTQLENLALLTKSVQIFQERQGRFPIDLNELTKSKIIEKIPEDPMGMEYKWDKNSERVVAKQNKRRTSQ